MWPLSLSVSAIFAVSLSAHAMQMSISPTGAARGPGRNITVMCTSDQPLVGCNFRVWYTSTEGTQVNQEYPAMDFRNGTESAKITATKWASGADLYSAEYSGRGLSERECGILFTRLSRGRYLVGCRGRAKTGDWGYDFMSLNVQYDEVERNYASSSPAAVNITSGTIKYTAVHGCALRACTFYLNGTRSVQIESEFTNPTFQNDTLSAQQNGGECSLTLKRVSERDNGLLWFTTTSCPRPASRINLYFKFIIFPKAPTIDDVSLLLVDHEGPYADGDELKATCMVTGSRPGASITLLLGDDTLSEGGDDADSAWRWPWDVASIALTVNWKLRAADSGSALTCRVKHPVLDGCVEENISIVVTDSASPSNAPSQGTETSSINPSSTNPSRTDPTVEKINHSQTNVDSAQNSSKPRAPVPETTKLPASTAPSGNESSTGRSIPGGDSVLVTVITVPCAVLALALLAALVYARVARKCCFRQAVAVSSAANQGKRRAQPAAQVPKPSGKGKPRAPSPGRDLPRMDLKRLELEDAVAYAEIVGAKTSDSRTETSIPVDTTYAELSFH